MAKPSNLRIEDVGAADARADLNDILISIASLQTTDGAGTGYTGEPTTTYPNMLWYDKATDILKMRSEADDAWITLGTLDQSLDTFAASIALASQVEAEAGTNNTKAMTPLRTAQAITELGLGGDQTWQNVTASRALSTTYTNTTGKPICLNIQTTGANNTAVDISANIGGAGLMMIARDSSAGTAQTVGSVIVPTGATYSVSMTNATIAAWWELR